ncbi:MAG TPA: FAD-dependent oxidoreductase [Chloroflexota bacterium]|nr:FAD-dependent oxidoreductase [Chloroflexota bacterium]
MTAMLDPHEFTALDDDFESTDGPGAVSGDERLPDRFDVTVVGGGFAGLVAAATAARAGRSVALFEQASGPGGRARTRTEHGFSFNIGAHALYRGMAGLAILRELGMEPRAVQPGTSGAYAVKDGQAYAFPFGLRSLLTTPLFDWRAKLEAGLFLGSIAKMDPRPLEDLTVREWIDRAVRHPSIRQLAEVLVRTATYADDPTEVSAAAGLRQIQAALTGALYVHGGWQTIVDDLRTRAQTLGARIVSGARVEEVELGEAAPTFGVASIAEGPRPTQAVRAVRLADGRRFEVGSAILAVPPQKANALVDAGRQGALAGWAERAVPIRAASLDVGLRRLPKPDDWFALGLDRPLYLSVHSKWVQVAPEGGSLVHVLRYLGPSPSAGAEDERELEGLLDLVQPGWRNEVVTRRFMPEITVAGALPSVSWEQRDGPRGPQVPGVAGLFVAGDWVGPDGMLADRAIQSGARAGQAAALRSSPALAGRTSDAAALLAGGGA